MGGPIAKRLVASDIRVTVWNRTAAKSAPFEALGATVAETPGDAADGTVITVLPDLSQVNELVDRPDGLLAGWAERRIEHPTLIIHGTTSPVATAEFAERMWGEHGVTVIDAPLSGGTLGAAAGTLSVMVGGNASASREPQPDLCAIWAHGALLRTVR